MEVKVGGIAVTANVLVPDTPCNFAVMVATPGALPMATPPLLIVATLVLEELQFAEAVTSCVLPLLYVPVAVNVSFVPTSTEVTAGVTWIDWRVTLLATAGELLPPPQPTATASIATIIDTRSFFIPFSLCNVRSGASLSQVQNRQEGG